MALYACAPQTTEDSAAHSSDPVTLRLAVSDEQGYPSEANVQEFIEQVDKLSNGEITVEPVWNAGSSTDEGFEAGVIQLVRDGEADLGLAASRAWESAGIKSFQALQAPFLIDNDALAAAVATSDIATSMLDGLTEFGIVGLTLWPEDLRHPFSTVPDKPILSPADISGRNFRVTDEGMSRRLIETLGGNPLTGDGGYDGAESGLRQAASLSGRPTATANITFFPKYQVLFANGISFEKLSETQQTVLREAAAATQAKAIDESPTDAEASKTWCLEVGAVVMASQEQVAAFEAAAQPVFDWLEQDPANVELIAAIRELKTDTPPSTGGEACAPAVAEAATPTPDPLPYSGDMPPNGAWQVTLTGDDVMRMGVSQANADEWSGVFTLTFKDGYHKSEWRGTEGSAKGDTNTCEATYTAVEDENIVRITFGPDCGNEIDDIQWRLDDDGLLHFRLVDIQNNSLTEIRAILEAKPYQKIGD
jgi:TRAP-type C4-dicarboxylate transport system substrate-binding protein